jgi:hypothetical protein
MLAAQLLLTFATLGYSLIPAVADLNNTHATNPNWVGHARFHVVWQVVSYLGIALIALALIWVPQANQVNSLWLVTAVAIAIYTGFFTATFSRRIYGGENYDPNGILPVRPPILGRYLAFEVNISIFSVMALLVFAATACLLMVRG